MTSMQKIQPLSGYTQYWAIDSVDVASKHADKGYVIRPYNTITPEDGVMVKYGGIEGIACNGHVLLHKKITPDVVEAKEELLLEDEKPLVKEAPIRIKPIKKQFNGE